ncbi:hypothetical protein QEN19_003770 [Hanseniaspora menglaensis]
MTRSELELNDSYEKTVLQKDSENDFKLTNNTYDKNNKQIRMDSFKNAEKNEDNNKTCHINNEPKLVVYDKIGFKVPINYQVKEIIGKGSYGTVVSATETAFGAQVAIKRVTNIFSRDILLKRAIRELKFMNYFKGHKNIINLLDLEIVFDKEYEGLYCFQEMIDYDLARIIHSSVQLSEFHIQSFFYQILCGLKYIHSADVVHRDLKPGNILCSIQGTLKICDFGLARGINEDCFQKIKNQTGKQPHITSYVATRWYRAPELMLCRKKYSKAIDLWACGCILAEFYGRKPVFIGNDQMHQVIEILKVLGTPKKETILNYGSSVALEIFLPPKPQYSKIDWHKIYPFASNQGIDLIEKLLNWDPERRLNCEQVLEHSFLKSVKNINDEPVCPYGIFNFCYESEVTSVSGLTKLLYKEVLEFKKTNFANNGSEETL